MRFTLSSHNVFDYLIALNLCTAAEKAQGQVELKYAKNFNLLLNLPNDRKLLVKQEPADADGKTAGEFEREWRMHEFLHQVPELHELQSCSSEAMHFDAENSIIVFNYLPQYRDLVNFHLKENVFPLAIAPVLGSTLAKLHRLTFAQPAHQEFFAEFAETEIANLPLHLAQGLSRITPDVFASTPADGLKFFALYQRYDSLGQAIAALVDSVQKICLIHNDLKLNNILVSTEWEQAEFPTQWERNSRIRLIDWERVSWGDPAFDLGTLIGSYLHLWLNSLITGKTISMDESLRLATMPLELMQPTIAALTISYLEEFPQILTQRPDFLQRVVQFAGMNLITAIQSGLQYQKTFGNTGICMLQVAKSLLCRPDAAMPTVFGMDAIDLLPSSLSLT